MYVDTCYESQKYNSKKVSTNTEVMLAFYVKEMNKFGNLGKQVGHVSRDCPRCSRSWTVKGEGVVNTQRFIRSEVKCFSCGQKGHIAMKCPAKVLCCRTTQRKEESRVENGRCYMGLEVC